jgi:hypothetical protein
MGSLLSSMFRPASLAVMLLILAPFVVMLMVFSVVLRKDEAHWSP